MQTVDDWVLDINEKSCYELVTLVSLMTDRQPCLLLLPLSNLNAKPIKKRNTRLLSERHCSTREMSRLS